jgi:hypothetical protein
MFYPTTAGTSACAPIGRQPLATPDSEVVSSRARRGATVHSLVHPCASRCHRWRGRASDGCAKSTDVGAKAFVPYEADYFFYEKDGK